MISSISGSMSIQAVSMTYEKQIQSLDAQVMRMEGQIGGFQEKIMKIQENENLTLSQKKENILPISEKISKVRQSIQEVNVKISEVRSQQVKAEDAARKRQRAIEEKNEQNNPKEDFGIDDSTQKSLTGIDIELSSVKSTKAQLNSRVREAEKEDMFRVRPDGKMVMIQNENRRPRNASEAKNAQNRLDNINSNLMRDAIKANSNKKLDENKPLAKKQKLEEENINEQNDKKQQVSSGTGRMEVGQFLEENA